MTLFELQKLLKKRVEEAAERAGFHGLQVFIRNLPPLKYEGEADQYLPRCIVELGEGNDEQGESTVEAELTFATKDVEPELKGYEEICHLIEIVRLSLAENPIVGGQFEIKKPINFTLGSLEWETYPHFFGAVWFDVLIPGPGPNYSDLT